ncbi:hypothetical protein RFI_01673 [Reticulomyxa filosa]|uniref:Uncharacterized protein n=1 Tax=Reticulomyxa filosa TaxID=46433 RepID=X6PA46_RETFI|nr:hypothetical protein RFI_01673 [Reticulomyxa filosa]|eukprot:ETO35390.1 hypothetical protein RFI_01673 [Reticulomyxa filosa]
MYNHVLIDNAKCNGGMQDNNNNRKYIKEIKTLVRLFGDANTEEELQQKIEHHYGNIETVIKDLVQQSIEKEVFTRINTIYSVNVEMLLLFFFFFLYIQKTKKKNKLEVETKINELKNTEQKQEQENIVNEINSNNKSVQKETEKTEIGEKKRELICKDFVAMKPVWHQKRNYHCPDCKKSTVISIVKAMFYNSEHSISASDDSVPVNDNNYQCSYTIKSGLSYELKANKIRQHANGIEDLRERSEHAMNKI